MSDVYRIFGAEVSPYSVKVRSYFRYKRIPHEWIVRSNATQAEYQKYARLPLIPVVATPEGEGIQDSTPILEKMEQRFPEPSIHPQEPVSAFVSALLEEFGDEWGNKWMFHYRWAREADQQSGAERIVRSMMPGLEGEPLRGMVRGVVDRMVGRVWFVGSNERTAPLIEASYREGMQLLQAHLESRPYLFGGRPAFGDFGLWGQVYNAWTDPTAGAILNQDAPDVVAWVKRMLEPEALGPFEPWSALEPTLLPLLERQVGALFLPWSDANARAIAEGAEEFSVELRVGTWAQKPQKYHARSLSELRRRYAPLAADAKLRSVLDRTSCLRWLA
jgi:glutathione S-transferase